MHERRQESDSPSGRPHTVSGSLQSPVLPARQMRVHTELVPVTMQASPRWQSLSNVHVAPRARGLDARGPQRVGKLDAKHPLAAPGQVLGTKGSQSPTGVHSGAGGVSVGASTPASSTMPASFPTGRQPGALAHVAASSSEHGVGLPSQGGLEFHSHPLETHASRSV